MLSASQVHMSRPFQVMSEGQSSNSALIWLLSLRMSALTAC